MYVYAVYGVCIHGDYIHTYMGIIYIYTWGLYTCIHGDYIHIHMGIIYIYTWGLYTRYTPYRLCTSGVPVCVWCIHGDDIHTCMYTRVHIDYVPQVYLYVYGVYMVMIYIHACIHVFI